MARKPAKRRTDSIDIPGFPDSNSIPYQIYYLSRLMQADFQELTAETGTQPAQAFVLRELWLENPLSQVEIARNLDTGKATIGESLKRLERDGFVERVRSTEDGRRIDVCLTSKGKALRVPLAKAAWAQHDMVAALLGAEEADRFSESLARVVEALKTKLNR